MNKKQNVKYCPNCGKQLPADAKFCTNCGHKFTNAPVQNQPSASKSANNVAPLRENQNTKHWNPNHHKKLIAGLVALVIICGVGASAYHHHTTQQQVTQQQNNQQPSDQNNNQQNNQQNAKQNFRKNKYIQAKGVLEHYCSDVDGYTASGGVIQRPEKSDPNKTHSFVDKSALAQYYVGGAQNSSMKQMLNWCENQAKAKTPVKLGFMNFQLHHIAGDKYEETYKMYYAFMPQPSPTAASNGARVKEHYQAVTWHAIVKGTPDPDGTSSHWKIIKANSSTHVTKLSESGMKKAGFTD